MREFMANRLRPFRSSVFEETSALAERYHAIDLGSGTPDLPVPEAVTQAVAAHGARFYGHAIDPLTEVTVTSGVTEGLHAALASFVDPGDEVVVFEPFYDSYAPSIVLAGGLPSS